jgi:hypothetical protein
MISIICAYSPTPCLVLCCLLACFGRIKYSILSIRPGSYKYLFPVMLILVLKMTVMFLSWWTLKSTTLFGAQLKQWGCDQMLEAKGTESIVRRRRRWAAVQSQQGLSQSLGNSRARTAPLSYPELKSWGHPSNIGWLLDVVHPRNGVPFGEAVWGQFRRVIQLWTISRKHSSSWGQSTFVLGRVPQYSLQRWHIFSLSCLVFPRSPQTFFLVEGIFYM